MPINYNGGRHFGNSPLAQNLNYVKAPYKNGKPETNSVGLPLVLKEDPSNIPERLQQTPELETGVPSFINPYALLAFPTRFGSSNSPFSAIIDDPSSPYKFSSPSYVSLGEIQNIEPTVHNLVNTPPDGSNSGVFGAKMPYRYTDFLYCKYYGKIPNNYLITLRRYPAPTYDNLALPLNAQEGSSPEKTFDFKPIAQAVTWLGEETENKLSDLLGFEVSMAWKMYESQVETYGGNEQSADEGPGLFQGASKFLTIATGILSGGKMGSAHEERNSQYDPYANGPYSHRVYGPVNVIGKTYKRDRGLDFKQNFTLNFHYSLKSISGINPKAAMLDIMSNMLQLTYNNAAFWGGANRYFAQKPVYPFLGGRDGMNAWYRGDPQGFIKAVGKQINSDTGILKEIGDLFDALSEDPISALKKLAVGGITVGMKMMGRGRAPDIVGMKALLTGEPIGEWHMILGNPYSPILQVGNLICTGAKFQFNDTLGADNFPTELKVAISIEHGRPRDKGDIESMFNEGEGRIYYAPEGKANLFRSSAEANSRNDTGWSLKSRQSLLRKQFDTKPEFPVMIEAQKPIGNGGKPPADAMKKVAVPDPNSGAANRFDAIIDDLKWPFTTGNGHELAIKMGLASAGTYKKPDTKTTTPQK